MNGDVPSVPIITLAGVSSLTNGISTVVAAAAVLMYNVLGVSRPESILAKSQCGSINLIGWLSHAWFPPFSCHSAVAVSPFPLRNSVRIT